MQKEVEINPGVIISKLDLKEDDTILITIDTDKWDVDEASEIYKIVAKIFPNNNIITTFKGLEIDKLKEKKV